MNFSKVAMISVFNKHFGSLGCFKLHFNIFTSFSSSSSSVNTFRKALRKHGFLEKIKTRKDIVKDRLDGQIGVAILDRNMYEQKTLEKIMIMQSLRS